MHRALSLARKGEGNVSPNPMVGAVIVCGDRIIGEGFHRCYGEPHAEVNAINSVKEEDRPLLKEATMYVTLEPCSHFGKTPPCADLVVKTGIPRVVIGSKDPNPKVAGKGKKILKEAGVEVVSGILEKECKDLNRRFMKAHTDARPWIILKWAQSADGYMAGKDNGGNLCSTSFSSPLSKVWMHRERGSVDAIMIGTNTEKIDRPRLDVRSWTAHSPIKIIADSHKDLKEYLEQIRREGITSLMVEGGPTLLESFLSRNLFDEIRVETSPIFLEKGIKAPDIPNDIKLMDSFKCRDNEIRIFRS